MITTNYVQLEEHSYPINDLRKINVYRQAERDGKETMEHHHTLQTATWSWNIKIRDVSSTHKNNSTILTAATAPQSFMKGTILMASSMR